MGTWASRARLGVSGGLARWPAESKGFRVYGSELEIAFTLNHLGFRA